MNIDLEMQALLGAYAMGTLTPEQKSRLMQKALDNQALFDALMDEETSRAALDNPLVKRALANLLEQSNNQYPELHAVGAAAPMPQQQPPKSQSWPWAALAVCLVAGLSTVALWNQPEAPAPQQVAINTPPPPALAPSSPPPSPAPKSKPAPRQPEPPPAVVADREESKTAERVKKLESADLPQFESNSVSKSLASPARSRADAGNSAAAVAAVVDGILVLRKGPETFAYAFLIDGETTTPLAPGASIPAHGPTAQIWVYFSLTEDPVLARSLTGVLPLPTRPWIKLPLPPQ